MSPVSLVLCTIVMWVDLKDRIVKILDVVQCVTHYLYEVLNFIRNIDVLSDWVFYWIRKNYLDVLHVDASHDRASIFDLFKSPPPVSQPHRVMVINYTNDLHSRLRGRLGPDGRSAGIVTPAAQTVSLPLAARLARDVVALAGPVLPSVGGQVCRGRRVSKFVNQNHLQKLFDFSNMSKVKTTTLTLKTSQKHSW